MQIKIQAQAMVENPRGIDVMSFAKARATELHAVFNALRTRSGARRVVCRSLSNLCYLMFTSSKPCLGTCGGAP